MWLPIKMTLQILSLSSQKQVPRVINIIAFLILLGTVLYFGHNEIVIITQNEYEGILNSVAPSNFTLIDSQFGSAGTGGTLSLERRYKVNGTRELILKELELKLNKNGYVLEKNGYYKGYGYNEYWTTYKNHANIDIRLFPMAKNLSDTDYFPNADVKEVELLFSD